MKIIKLYRKIKFSNKFKFLSIKFIRIGGMTNINYKVIVFNFTYVLRIPGKASNEFIERYYERENSDIAYELGTSPKILYLDSNTGVKLSQYIVGAVTLNLNTILCPNNIRKVIYNLKKLHCSKKYFNNEFNVFDKIRLYEYLLFEKYRGIMYDGYEKYRLLISGLSEKLKSVDTELCPCHNDLVAENFVQDVYGEIYLIDWEYSGMNDPVWDLASLFLESDFNNKDIMFTLNLYYEGSIPSRILGKIIIYQILMDILWSIWACIKTTLGVDFGTYGLVRYNRAITNLMKII